jgi:hypothetical protein
MSNQNITNDPKYLYNNIQLLFRHTDIDPTIDITNFKLFKEYLAKVGPTNLNSNVDVAREETIHEKIKKCLEKVIIDIEKDEDINTLLGSAIETLQSNVNIPEIDETTRDLLQNTIIPTLETIKTPSQIYFIQYKLFTHKEYIIYNILKFLSYIDDLQKLNYQWFKNVSNLLYIFDIIKKGINEDVTKSNNKLDTSTSKDEGKSSNPKKGNVSKSSSLLESSSVLESETIDNAVIASAITASIASASTPTNIRGGLKLSDLDYIKERIKIKISLIEPKQKVLYQ